MNNDPGDDAERERRGASPWASGHVHQTRGIAPIPFVHGLEPEDFRVHELAAGELAQEGTHLYVTIEKRGISTLEAARRLAGAVGRGPEEVGFAGRKDTHAVTRQRLSIEHVDPEQIRALQLEGMRVLEVQRHTRKLRLGDLSGNRFDLLLRDLPADRRGDLEDALAQLTREGLPNYFGAQRFGRGGRTHELGHLLARGDWAGYLAALVSETHAGPGEARGELERALASGTWRERRALGRLAPQLASQSGRDLALLATQLARRPKDLQSAVRALPRRTKAFHLSALQARVFNRVLAARMGWPGGPTRVVLGDLVLDPWGGAGVPVREEAQVDQCQSASGSLAQVPSGPLPGPAAARTGSRVAALEAEALAEEGVTLEDLARLPGPLPPKGARRALVVAPRDISWSEEGPHVRLGFCLPPGAYATVLLEELRKTHGAERDSTPQ